MTCYHGSWTGNVVGIVTYKHAHFLQTCNFLLHKALIHRLELICLCCEYLLHIFVFAAHFFIWLVIYIYIYIYTLYCQVLGHPLLLNMSLLRKHMRQQKNLKRRQFFNYLPTLSIHMFNYTGQEPNRCLSF